MARFTKVVLIVVLAGWALVPTSAKPAFAASCGSWDLTADFLISPNEANPAPDSCGATNTWYYEQGNGLTHDPSSYTPLSTFTASWLGVSGIQGWQGTYVQVDDRLPSVRVNTTGTAQTVNGFTWPAGALAVHPGPSNLVVIGWRSPITASVTVGGSATEIDPGCGNGVAWSVDKGSTTVASGTLPDGGSEAFAAGTDGASLINIPVSTGDYLYFVVDPHGDYFCDTTALDVRISPSTVPSSLDNNLAAYWAANGTADDVVTGNHGSLENGATLWPGSSTEDQAFSLDGVDDFVAPYAGSVNGLTNTISVSAWINARTPLNDWGGVIFAHRDPFVHEGFQLNLDPSGGVHAVVGTTTTSNCGIAFSSGPGVISFNRWHNVTATAATPGGTVHIYVDGQDVSLVPVAGCGGGASSTLTGTLYPVSGLWLGQRESSNTSEGANGGAHFNGLIDDVMVFNSELSQADVNGLMAAASPRLSLTSSLAPDTSGTVGSPITLTATLDNTANPTNTSVSWTISGANPRTATTNTDAQGRATFTYTPSETGTDSIMAHTSINGQDLAANPLSLTWRSGGTGCTTPSENLISCWEAEGNTQDTADVNPGTAVGSVRYGAGQVGQAFSFDASSYVSIPSGSSLEPMGQVTTEGWIKPIFAGRPSSDTVDMLIDNYDGTNGYQLFVGMNPASGAFYQDPTGVPLGTPGFFLSTTNGRNQIFSPSPLPNDGRYHFVAGTYDGTTMRLFVDGVDVVDRVVGGSILSSSSPSVHIGYEGIPGVYSDASIDEVGVYSRALSAQEITSIYNAGVAQAPSAPPLVPITGTDPGFPASPYPYAGTAVTVEPYPPTQGQQVRLGAILQNPTSSDVTLDSVDFAVSGYGMGLPWQPVGSDSNVTIPAGTPSDPGTAHPTIPWTPPFSGHHCVLVTLHFHDGHTQVLQRNTDILGLSGDGSSSFTVGNPGGSQATITLKIVKVAESPTGWTASLDQDSFTLDPGASVGDHLTITPPANAQPGDYATFNVEEYIGDTLIGGISKTVVIGDSLPAPTLTSPTSGSSVPGDTTLTGTSLPYALIQVGFGDETHETIADGSGNWSFDVSLPGGGSDLIIKQTVGGIISPPAGGSDGIHLVVGPVVDAGSGATIDEGSPFSGSGSFVDAAGSSWTATVSYGDGTGTQTLSLSGKSFSLSHTYADNGSYTVTVSVTNDHQVTGSATTTVTVRNVAPTITAVSGAVTRTLTGASVTFTGTATDPSSADTAAGFSWHWAVDGGSFGSYGAAGQSNFTTSFATCGTHTVTGQAKDKDNGVSASASTSIDVYEAHYQSPLTEGAYNAVAKNQVVAVRITVACTGTLLTGLAPTIQLLKGDLTPGTETATDAVPTTSPGSANTDGVMKATTTGYQYNLQMPGDKSIPSGTKYSIRVRPFGDGNPNAGVYIVVQIK